MKKIILIGGTSRSGSTLLDMILANDPNAQSLGEIIALFHPTRKHHFEEIKRLQKNDLWSQILKDGKRRLFPNLAKYFPDTDIFVDSSKDPFWLRYHQNLNKEEFEIYNVLIYKSPEELAHSFIKRGKNKEWLSTYKNYHRKYISLIREYYSIAYQDLMLNKNSLPILCQKLSIPYFSSKMNYWERNQNTFFGSNTTKKNESLNTHKQLEEIQRRDLQYDRVVDENLVKVVSNILKKDPKLEKIIRVIMSHNILKDQNRLSPEDLKYNTLKLLLFSTKKYIKGTYRYFKPIDYFRN